MENLSLIIVSITFTVLIFSIPEIILFLNFVNLDKISQLRKLAVYYHWWDNLPYNNVLFFCKMAATLCTNKNQFTYLLWWYDNTVYTILDNMCKLYIMLFYTHLKYFNTFFRDHRVLMHNLQLVFNKSRK